MPEVRKKVCPFVDRVCAEDECFAWRTTYFSVSDGKSYDVEPYCKLVMSA